MVAGKELNLTDIVSCNSLHCHARISRVGTKNKVRTVERNAPAITDRVAETTTTTTRPAIERLAISHSRSLSRVFAAGSLALCLSCRTRRSISLALSIELSSASH